MKANLFEGRGGRQTLVPRRIHFLNYALGHSAKYSGYMGAGLRRSSTYLSLPETQFSYIKNYFLLFFTLVLKVKFNQGVTAKSTFIFF